LSTYKPESEISRLNAAAPAPVRLSADTLRALASALEWGRRTGGAFNVAAGALVKTWGFHAAPRLPEESDVRAALELVRPEDVRLAPSGEASLAKAGMELDFGGVGKGWALDRALEKARAAADGLEELVMDFGGQLLFWSAAPRTWPAAVRDPRNRGGSPRTLQLRAGGSLSTSAATEKFLVVPDPKAPGGGLPKRYGHILDPRTGFPAEPCESVTVWAPEAEAADALSTALFVLGPAEGLRHADAEGVAALIVYTDPKRGVTSVASIKWKELFEP
jgi:FAD:protein FMN transferase